MILLMCPLVSTLILWIRNHRRSFACFFRSVLRFHRISCSSSFKLLCYKITFLFFDLIQFILIKYVQGAEAPMYLQSVFVKES